jgi:hypothetical protein
MNAMRVSNAPNETLFPAVSAGVQLFADRLVEDCLDHTDAERAILCIAGDIHENPTLPDEQFELLVALVRAAIRRFPEVDWFVDVAARGGIEYKKCQSESGS